MIAEHQIVRLNEEKVLSSNGVRIAIKTWEVNLTVSSTTTRQHVLITHGLGLCKEVMQPIIEEFLLMNKFFSGTIALMDSRYHGESDAGVTGEEDWWPMAIDVILLVQYLCKKYEASSIIGLGHSMGGCLLTMAAHSGAALSGLFLIEPIIFGSPCSINHDDERAQGALKRRTTFPSFREALDYFSSKTLFKLAQPRSIELYVNHCFKETDSGEWVLRMPNTVEASMFAHGSNTGMGDLLHTFIFPVYLGAGEISWWPRSIGRGIGERLKVHVDLYPGLTHMCIMEEPKLIANRFNKFLDRCKSNK